MRSQIQEGTQEWLDARRNAITATDSYTILNINPWSSPFKLWQQKLNILPATQQNEAMRKGQEQEPFARALFEERTGLIMEKGVFFHDDHPWIMSSLDGYNEKENVHVEIKCSKKTYDLAAQGLIPDYYSCQMNHQMFTINTNKCFYFCFFNGDGICIEVLRDNDFVTRLLVEEKKFYRMLMDLECPELTDKDYETRSDEEWLTNAQNLISARTMKKKYEEMEEAAKQTLIMLAGPSNVMGGNIKLSKVLKKGFIDYRAAQADGIDLERYRKPSTESYRVLSIAH